LEKFRADRLEPLRDKPDDPGQVSARVDAALDALDKFDKLLQAQ
jgi:hypothetical protein